MKIRFLIILLILSNTSFLQEKDIGVWEVNELVLSPSEEYDNALAQKYWEKVKSYLPLNVLKEYAISFRIFTDGEGGDLAAMLPLDYTGNIWQVEIDTADIPLGDLDSLYQLDVMHSMIHEFGHLLTLNGSQLVELIDNVGRVEDRYLTEGCQAFENSYIELFINDFWEGKIYDDWNKLESIDEMYKDENDVLLFYWDNQNEFVSTYAATHPEEDICESWAYFVLGDRPTDLKQTKYQKINFFYNFPKLVEYRAEIRKKLDFIPIEFFQNYIPFGDENVASDVVYILKYRK